MGEVLGWATSLSQPLRNPHPLLAAVLTSTKVNAQLTTDQAAALTTRCVRSPLDPNSRCASNR